jgi:hypothetical protein
MLPFAQVNAPYYTLAQLVVREFLHGPSAQLQAFLSLSSRIAFCFPANRTSCTLTLSNLPTHNAIQIGFLLAILNSWDGSSENDRFEVLLDGQTLFTETFDNFFTNDQTYVPPANVQIVDRIDLPPYNKAFPNLGFGGIGTDWGDAGYDMYFEPRLQNIAHSSSSATIVFRATYSGMSLEYDEYWGIDNLKVTLYGTATVPEPTSGIVFGFLGLASLKLRNRKRCKQQVDRMEAP